MNWSYLAGYFDADGNFSMNFNPKKESFQLLFRIYSTNKKSLVSIKKFTGLGNIFLSKKGENRTDCYEYTISKKQDVLFILKKISKILIVKKEQADYLLKNFDFRYNSNKYFNLDEFRESITRKNQYKNRKYTNSNLPKI